MNYKIQPSVYAGVFALPVQITDTYLKIAPPDFIKVILYFFRNSTKICSLEQVSSDLSMSLAEVEDACGYWAQEGFLLEEHMAPDIKMTQAEVSVTPSPAVLTQKSDETDKPQTPQKDFSPIKHTRPSYSDIVTRINESEEIRFLFSAAQERLGRTIGSGDQSALLDLHDYFGLSVELILVLCEYAKTHGKGTNMGYIYTMGMDWSKREIDSIEAADEELKHLESLNAIWLEFCKISGCKKEHPTTPQKRYIDMWTGEWKLSAPLLALAYEEMSRYADKPSFGYMNSILANWHQNRITTTEEALHFQEEHRKKQDEAAAKRAIRRGGSSQNAQAQAPQSEASYDINLAIQQANAGVPTLRKKKPQ